MHVMFGKMCVLVYVLSNNSTKLEEILIFQASSFPDCYCATRLNQLPLLYNI